MTTHRPPTWMTIAAHDGRIERRRRHRTVVAHRRKVISLTVGVLLLLLVAVVLVALRTRPAHGEGMSVPTPTPAIAITPIVSINPPCYVNEPPQPPRTPRTTSERPCLTPRAYLPVVPR